MRMKIFSRAPDPAKLSPTQRWGCAVMNQLACPGLGTIMAGRRVGYAQATIMVAGFVLLMGFMIWFIICAARYLIHADWDEGRWRAQYRPYHWAWQSGLGLCVVAWCWSLVSSIGIVREGRRNGA